MASPLLLIHVQVHATVGRTLHTHRTLARVAEVDHPHPGILRAHAHGSAVAAYRMVQQAWAEASENCSSRR